MIFHTHIHEVCRAYFFQSTRTCFFHSFNINSDSLLVLITVTWWQFVCISFILQPQPSGWCWFSNIFTKRIKGHFALWLPKSAICVIFFCNSLKPISNVRIDVFLQTQIIGKLGILNSVFKKSLQNSCILANPYS